MGERIIGIDFGTSNSCVAVYSGGEPEVIPNLDGSDITPSYISIPTSGKVVVGQQAKEQALLNPLTALFNLKLFLGKTYADIEQLRPEFPYPIRQDEQGRVVIIVHDREYHIEELISFILKYLKISAETYLQESVTEVVYTIPIDFRKEQVDALKEASLIAGIKPARIIRESTAACLAYGISATEDETVLVFDLGGGSLDVSIIETGEGVYEVISTSGSLSLGGRDFDKAIVQHLVHHFIRTENVNFSSDPIIMARLMMAAEQAKISLSKELETQIDLPFIAVNGQIKNLKVKLDRATLRQLVQGLLQRCVSYAGMAIEESGFYRYEDGRKVRVQPVQKQDITKVLLVGSGTKMPFIQEVLSQYFAMAVAQASRPEFTVVEGAAIQAGILMGEVRDQLLLDIIVYSLGIKVGDQYEVVVQRNTTIPCKISADVELSLNANNVEVQILEFNSATDLDRHRVLQTVRLPLSGAVAEDKNEFTATFDIDANEILVVELRAKDDQLFPPKNLRIEDFKRFSANDIERIQERISAFEKVSREEYELFKRTKIAEQTLANSRHQLKQYQRFIAPEGQAKIEQLNQALEASIQAADVASLAARQNELNQEWQVISQVLYLRQDEVAEAERQRPAEVAGEIEQILITGNLTKALEGLLQNPIFSWDNQERDELIMQSFLHESNERKRRMNVISTKDYKLVRSQVSYAILHYINLVRKQVG